MDNSRWERIGAASGIVAGVLVLGAFLSLPAPPKLNELSKTMTYLADHRTGALVQAYLFLLSTGFFIWFAGSVRTHLRRNEAGSGRLPDVAFGGALVASAMIATSSALLATAAFRADTAASATNIRLMTDLGSIAFAMAFVPFAVFIGACGIASYRSSALPVAHSVVSMVVAIGSLAAPLLILGRTGFFSLNEPFGGLVIAMFALLAWELATSVMLIVGEAADTAAETEGGKILGHEHWHLRRVAGE